ncbi:uncharacterized protein LOC143890297 [Tasmannia lanceolata]|uniref:uncharacterized protein LOC143890297 n=1 Tax=Tasmannia lanceolata TaxID=3420 RepID=UPI004064591A
MAPPTPSPLSKKSRVRVRVSSMFLQTPWCFLLFLSILSTKFSSSSSSSLTKFSYTQHCNSLIPKSISNGIKIDPLGFLQFQGGYFTGGENFLGQNSQSSFSLPKSIHFTTTNLYKTEIEGVLKVEANLDFRGGSLYAISGNRTAGRSLYNRRPRRIPRTFRRRGRLSLELEGFWSESTGKFCLIGSGFGYSKLGNSHDLSVVVKLNYPKISNISTSFVTGTVESLDAYDNSNYFDPISLLAFSQKTYEYTMISQAEKACSSVDGMNKSLSLESGMSICSRLWNLAGGGFKLEYDSSCSSRNCSPFGMSVGSLPTFMSMGGIQCGDKGRLHMYLGFSNSSYNGYSLPLAPESTLVGEGIWDGEKNRLCVVACRLMNFAGSLANTSVGDCTVRLVLGFPAILSIRERSSAVGHMWSDKNVNDSGYFEKISFRSLENRGTALPGLTYEYTEMDRVRESCGKNTVKKSRRRYPDGYSFGDMRFDMSVKNTQGKTAWGYSTPVAIGDRFYNSISVAVALSPESYERSFSVASSSDAEVQVLKSNHSLLNVSYMISFTLSRSFQWGGFSSSKMFSGSHIPIDISAEGIYDTETGVLCMVGCRSLGSNNSMDCGILINVQLSPLNPESEVHLKGTIKSTRGKRDPIYFEPLELSSNSIYTAQAEKSIWRMDLEITMVLISLTLACVFIGLQLFYMKKHPDVIPSMSLMMLVILTLWHMIPLVLNFEAFFLRDRNRDNVLLWSGGWLEANEVIVRVVTMVAFVLQFRLLQLTWSARLAEGSKKSFWAAEKKAVCLCLPLYLVGGLIAWFFRWKMYQVPLRKSRMFHHSRHSIWEDLRSYAGLVLDGFLVPQILLNFFGNSKDKALSPFFYVGTTVVRSLPHAYDAYRTREYIPHFNASYIYANPEGDYYSIAWDVIIPCGGLLFCILIYLQQRFGGTCILPMRFRQPSEYEKVPVVSG